MRVSSVATLPVTGAHATGVSAARVRPAVSADEAERALHLPVSVADRITRIMSADPGLAAAVSAHLPEARRESARQLAGLAQATPAHLVDTVG